jgi:predicted HicB family RNase H-like nuclease
MEYKGYLGKVEVEDDDFYGVVVNLHRDHVDFRGRTIDEVREAFHDSVDFYLKGREEDGEEPERPFSGRFVVRLPPATHRRASTLSRIENRSLNAVVADAIETYLTDRGV